MPASPLEKLERLIPELLEETRRLREHNTQLSEEIEGLRVQLQNHEETRSQWDVDRKRLTRLEEEQRRHEGERDELRSRVQGLLEELENIDFL